MDIIEEYQECGTIRAVAQKLGISEQKVKKALISAGVYENETGREVRRLYSEGKTIQEIGALLEIGKSAVHANLPYTKGEYKKENASPNALCIRRHREKKNPTAQV